MKNTAIKKRTNRTAEPELLTIFKKAEQEHQKSEEMFKLMGWEGLPAVLKFEIEEDVKGYVDELTGSYSTNCPFVQRRRESVDFWVQSYMNGICSLNTAVESLKVSSL